MQPFHLSDTSKVLIAPFRYVDTTLTLNSVIILSPPLTVIHHDMTTGRILFDASTAPFFLNKLQTLQETIAQALYSNQASFLGIHMGLTTEHFKKMLFSLVNNKKLTLFMGGSARSVSIHSSSGTTTTGIHREFQMGQRLRIAFQLQGLSILANPQINPQQILEGQSPFRIRFQQATKAIFVI
jgi:hypothetical protein